MMGCSAAPVDERPQRQLSYKVTIVQGLFPKPAYDELCRTIEAMFTLGSQRFCRYSGQHITVHGYKIFYIRREVSLRCPALLGDFSPERVRTDLELTTSGPSAKPPHAGSGRPSRTFWGPSKPKKVEAAKKQATQASGPALRLRGARRCRPLPKLAAGCPRCAQPRPQPQHPRRSARRRNPWQPQRRRRLPLRLLGLPLGGGIR